MKLNFDIKCSDYTNTPAYRVFVNGELMLERDFVIPNDEFSHYNFTGFIDSETADIQVESVTPGITFTYDNVRLTNESE